MTTKSYGLTLTRWHKVAERVQAEMTRLSAACDAKLAQMNMSLSARNTAKEDTVTAAAAEVESMLAQHAELNDSLTAIRTALATANVKHGVSALLSKVDGLNRRMKALTSLYTIESGKQHAFADYKAMEATAVASDGLTRVRATNSDTVKVKVLSAERLTQIDRSIQEIRRDIHALSDDIADLNRAKLSIDLPEVAAKAAGIDRE